MRTRYRGSAQPIDASALWQYDQDARLLAGGTWDDFVSSLDDWPEEHHARLLTMRCRWRLDDFAVHVMSQFLEEIGKVSPWCALDDDIYGPEPHRVGFRPAGLQRLVMTGRGVGKSMRQRIRAFHGLLYGLRKVSMTFCGKQSDVDDWTETMEGWARQPAPILAAMFPELEASRKGIARDLVIRTRFGRGLLVSRGWQAGARGTNKGGFRPDAVDLDDIEKEENSRSVEARNATQQTLSAKILPLAPNNVNADFIWTQTPIGPDAVSARIVRGDEELRGWEHRTRPVITRWPDSPRWGVLRRIYFDSDAIPDKADRVRAVVAEYEANRTELDAGAEVLDPVGMGVLRCHIKLWDMGRSAFATEYEMSTRPVGATFDPGAWPRFELLSGVIVRSGLPSLPIVTAPLWAHLDTSDGGDNAALVVATLIGGRVYALRSAVWEGSKLTRQLREIPDVLAPFTPYGLRVLHWEPPPGAESLVRQRIAEALAGAGLPVSLVEVHSTERKTTRIVNTLEPLSTAGLLAVPHDIDPACISEASVFDPDRSNNADDWLDAFQRCAEGLLAGAEEVTYDEFYSAMGA